MLGSVEDAEDLLQETFLRAWRHLAASRAARRCGPGCTGSPPTPAWARSTAALRRVLPPDLGLLTGADVDLAPCTDVAWLQFPDQPLEPADAVVARETIELAFPGRTPAPAARPAGGADPPGRGRLAGQAGGRAARPQRGRRQQQPALRRAALRDQLPADRSDWRPPAPPSEDERAVVRRYMGAERADLEGIAALLAEDVRVHAPVAHLVPRPRQGGLGPGRTAGTGPAWLRQAVPHAGRRGQPPARGGVLHPDARRCRVPPFALGVLRIEGGVVAETVSFHDVRLFDLFGLPPTLPPVA